MKKKIVLTTIGLIVVLTMFSFVYFMFGMWKSKIYFADIESVAITPRCSILHQNNVFGKEIEFEEPLSSVNVQSKLKIMSDPELKQWYRLVNYSFKNILPMKSYGLYNFHIKLKGGDSIKLIGGNTWIRMEDGDIYIFQEKRLLRIFHSDDNK